MLVLALDTSATATAVALHDGAHVLVERRVDDGRGHAEVLAPTVAEALAAVGGDRRDISLVACGLGPGPFTGLRVGVVTARVLGAALGVPVVGACSLDALARTARDDGTTGRGDFLVVTDARRREVYWARYDAAGRRLDGPLVERPAQVAADCPGLPAVGAGALDHPADFPSARGPRLASAGALAALVVERLADGNPLPGAPSGSPFADDDPSGRGAGDIPAGVLLPAYPIYLRRPDARPPGAPKRVTPP